MKIDYITDTYKLKNEDIYGVTDYSFWILDGASPLNKSNYTDELNDVVWMVNWWNDYLKENLNNFRNSLFEILEVGVDKLNCSFGKFIDIDCLSKLDRASASIAITRINEKKLECFVLGDVEIITKKKTGELEVLTDHRIEPLDKSVMELILSNDNRENEIEFNGYTRKELELLQHNRMKMNTADGYYILEHDKKAIKNGIYREYNIDDVADILMMTDGYSAIYNKYNKYEKLDLINECKSQGVKRILSYIRDIELKDNKREKYKRLKIHDDATAILCEFD